MIADELGTKSIDLKTFDKSMIDVNTLVIYGGSLHAVGINGFKEFKKKSCGIYKSLIVFAVGASPKKEGVERELIDSNFNDEEKENIRLFYLRGGFDNSKLDIKNRILMRLLKMKIQIKKENKRTGDEKGMLAAFKKPLDAVNRENIKELADYVRSLNMIN